jgi:parallel beta-helix repeat protein
MARALLMAGALLALAAPASAQHDIDTARVDGIFARWSSSSTPGGVTPPAMWQPRVYDLQFERAQIPELRVQPDAPLAGPATRSGALNAALASAGARPVRVLLAPGRYILDAEEYVDPACGNCEDATETVPATVGATVKGRGIEIRGVHADSVIIETRAGYGLLFDECSECVLRGVTITGGTRDADGRATSAGIVARHSTAIIESCVIRDNIGDSATVARTIVGIAGIAVRENTQLTVRDCRIMRNSWDGIALYRGASATIEGNIVDGVDKASGARVGGGRGVGIGLTWDAQATIRHNLVRRYWKGIGAFVNARADISENIVEDILTWGIALWGPNGATPSARIRRNVVYRTGACGVMIDRPAGGAAPGELTDNIIMRSGQNERYDAGEPYCWQRPIARASVPETFSESGNLLTDNRQPRDAGSAPAPLPEIDIAALAGHGAALAQALHAHAALRNALFFVEHPALVRR